jgi:plastocyanin
VLATLAPGAALAGPPTPEPGFLAPLGSDVQHLHFRYGPIHVLPGQNLISFGPVSIEKPAYDGYVVGFKPNLVLEDGSVPPVDVLHLHHGVWLNVKADGTQEKFAAAGEEKTQFHLPPGYGYPVKGTDVWLLNHMLHNLTPQPEEAFITYDIDFVPADSALGRTLTAVHPFWNDVEDGKAYPVFDVKRSDGVDGRLTYPKGDNGHNVRTIGKDETIVWLGGHVHPGGLDVDLDAVRNGQKAHLFTSSAKYWDPGGPISWDMAMTVTPPDYRVALKKGDRLDIHTTYETEHASWYESMGIMVGWVTDGTHGPDAFAGGFPTTGEVTHGHLPENDNHGGAPTGLPDPFGLPDGQTLSSQVGIAGFSYLPGNSGLTGPLQNPPVVAPGQSLTFSNADAPPFIFHTVTACKAPCSGSTGISYPLANGPIDFDSGELGYGVPGYTAAANAYQWKTPANLPTGTYTYFCRVHPYMRGAFRVK